MQVIWLNSDFWCSHFPKGRSRTAKKSQFLDEVCSVSGTEEFRIQDYPVAVTKGRRLVAPWSAEKGTTSSCFHSLISSGRLHSLHTGDLNPLQPVQKLSLKNVVCVDLTASLEGTKAVNRVSCWYREDYYSHRWVYMSKLLFACWVELSDVFLNMEKLIQSHI